MKNELTGEKLTVDLSENDEDAVEMETLETDILVNLGFPNPY